MPKRVVLDGGVECVYELLIGNLHSTTGFVYLCELRRRDVAVIDGRVAVVKLCELRRGHVPT